VRGLPPFVFVPQSCCFFLLNRLLPSFGASSGCRSPEIPLRELLRHD
jgi:hypothetical protein